MTQHSQNGEGVERIPTRPLCARCHRYIVVDSVATDALWREVIGEKHGPGYICADCFARAADERLIDWTSGLSFRPVSLAAQIGIQGQSLAREPATADVGREGFVLMPARATRAMVDAADACTDAYEAYGKMVEAGRVR